MRTPMKGAGPMPAHDGRWGWRGRKCMCGGGGICLHEDALVVAAAVEDEDLAVARRLRDDVFHLHAVLLPVCVCVCVCACERESEGGRERERERGGGGERERERGREGGG